MERCALAAKLDDPGRVDDNRVIAKLAAEILDPAPWQAQPRAPEAAKDSAADER